MTRKKITQITKQVVEVNKYASNHHRAVALFGEDSVQHVMKPHPNGSTKWNSQLK